MDLSDLMKVVIIGDSGVGKTQILHRLTKDDFDPNISSTIAVEFCTHDVTIQEGKTLHLQIWDTAGQERFKSITRAYYRDSSAAIIVFDVTDKNSFENISKWIEEIIEVTGNQIIVYIVGNKIDLDERRKIPLEEGNKLAANLSEAASTLEMPTLYQRVHYTEISAKTGYGINSLFENLASTLSLAADLDGYTIFPNQFLDIQNNSTLAADASSCCAKSMSKGKRSYSIGGLPSHKNSLGIPNGTKKRSESFQISKNDKKKDMDLFKETTIKDKSRPLSPSSERKARKLLQFKQNNEKSTIDVTRNKEYIEPLRLNTTKKIPYEPTSKYTIIPKNDGKHTTPENVQQVIEKPVLKSDIVKLVIKDENHVLNGMKIIDIQNNSEINDIEEIIDDIDEDTIRNEKMKKEQIYFLNLSKLQQKSESERQMLQVNIAEEEFNRRKQELLYDHKISLQKTKKSKNDKYSDIQISNSEFQDRLKEIISSQKLLAQKCKNEVINSDEQNYIKAQEGYENHMKNLINLRNEQFKMLQIYYKNRAQEDENYQSSIIHSLDESEQNLEKLKLESQNSYNISQETRIKEEEMRINRLNEGLIDHENINNISVNDVEKAVLFQKERQLRETGEQKKEEEKAKKLILTSRLQETNRINESISYEEERIEELIESTNSYQLQSQLNNINERKNDIMKLEYELDQYSKNEMEYIKKERNFQKQMYQSLHKSRKEDIVRIAKELSEYHNEDRKNTIPIRKSQIDNEIEAKINNAVENSIIRDNNLRNELRQSAKQYKQSLIDEENELMKNILNNYEQQRELENKLRIEQKMFLSPHKESKKQNDTSYEEMETDYILRQKEEAVRNTKMLKEIAKKEEIEKINALNALEEESREQEKTMREYQKKVALERRKEREKL